MNRRVGSGWVLVPGKMRQLGVGSDVMAANAAGELHLWTGTYWQRFVGQLQGGAGNVAVGADGSIWLVHGTGEVNQWR